MKIDLTVIVPDEQADEVTDKLSQFGDRFAFELESEGIEAQLILSDEFDTIADW